MTAALIVAGVVAYLTAYFAIGWAIAMKDLPHLWVRARKRWSSEGIIRSEVNAGTAMTLFFWPIRLPFIRIAVIADAVDPVELQRQLKSREKRIDELERELRIGRRP